MVWTSTSLLVIAVLAVIKEKNLTGRIDLDTILLMLVLAILFILSLFLFV